MPTGSFGTPVRRRDTGVIQLLTAAHVVGSLSEAHALDRTDVYLALNTAVAGSGDPLIGHVCESHPAAPTAEVELDASLVDVAAAVGIDDIVREHHLSGIARDVEASTKEGEAVIVYKRGITQPALTEGLLVPVPESLTIESHQSDGSVIRRDYLRGYLVYGGDGPFARPGDSGAIVIDTDDCVVGMLVGLRADDPHDLTAEDPAFVVPILDILQGMDVELPGPRRPCVLA